MSTNNWLPDGMRKELCNTYLNAIEALVEANDVLDGNIDSNTLEAIEAALKNLVEYGCRNSLVYLIEKYSGRVNSIREKARSKALVYLIKLDSGQII